MTSKEPSSNQSRIMSRLQRLLNEKSYYEALQLYLTLYARYLTSKGPEEAGDLLFDGIQVFLSLGQLESVEELAIKWAEHLRTHSIPVSEKEIDRVLTITKQFPVSQKEAAPVIKLMRICIKWSQENGERRVGDIALHYELADILWRLQRYSEAKKHFIHGGQPNDFALRVLDLSLKGGYPGETGLFITQTVLCMLGEEGYMIEANEVFRVFVTNHPHLVNAFPYKGYPLLNYTHMILEVLLDESVQQISTIEKCQYLTQQYSTALQADPSVMELINKLNFIQIHPFSGMMQTMPPCSVNQEKTKVEESEGLD
ncbi:hypothetical protein LOD99_13116 [Oopsacas minuta]|uniref:Uncharacterized protein n=1 Tax=Oopsacas minuta TaxID=111878 RepID=A0AAV7JAV9_9METZ|nr:hypothetical protein LOD99_13116 [Oopsacas minuta]